MIARGSIFGHWTRLAKSLQKDLHFEKATNLARIVPEDEASHGHKDCHEDSTQGDMRNADGGSGLELYWALVMVVEVAGSRISHKLRDWAVHGGSG